MYVVEKYTKHHIFVQNHRFGEMPTRSRMSLRLPGTIEPSAVDDRSFTGVASMGKLFTAREKINQPIPDAMWRK
jgi:hypothetical protein